MRTPSILFALITAAFASQASAITISTGSAAPWLVNGNPVVVETSLATPFWINNFGDGRWVGTTATDGGFTTVTDGAAPGTYTFTMNIGAYMGSAGGFSLQFAADNTIQWSITNGALLGTTSCLGDPASTDCFGSSAGAPRSMTGTFAANSILTATIVNGTTTRNPMGLLVVGNAFADENAVPLPSSLAILSLGTLALWSTTRRRKTV